MWYTFGLCSETDVLSPANRSNGYLITGNAIADQTTFFALGGFDPVMLNWTTENKGTIAYGELLTFGPPTVNATDFGGAVLAISGDQDLCVYS